MRILAIRPRALGDVRNDLLVVAPPFLRGQLGEIAVLGVVMAAVILARNADTRLAIVGKGQRVDRLCLVPAIPGGPNHLEPVVPEPLQLMTEADNIKFSRHKEVRGVGYLPYDNFDAIEVPFVDAIPSDYDGMMGVLEVR